MNDKTFTRLLHLAAVAVSSLMGSVFFLSGFVLGGMLATIWFGFTLGMWYSDEMGFSMEDL